MKIFVNFLTILRFLSTFILPIIWDHVSSTFVVVYIGLILLTDLFDGLLARKFHVQTLFGMIMDCVADKFFGLMILLIMAGYFKIFYINVIFEVLIALINLVAAFLGATTKSSFLGKTKTFIMGIGIFIGVLLIFKDDISNIASLYNIYNFINLDILFMFVYIASGAEVMVAVDYSKHIIRELRTSKKSLNYKLKSRVGLKKVLFDTEYFLKHNTQPLSDHLLK